MTERAIWEERLWTSNTPLPRRDLPDPRTDLRGVYGVPTKVNRLGEESTITVWWSFMALAPFDPSWTGAKVEDGRWQAVYLISDQHVRVALVDEHRKILDWRRAAGSSAYRQRQARAAPDLHPLERLHHRRGRRSS